MANERQDDPMNDPSAHDETARTAAKGLSTPTSTDSLDQMDGKAFEEAMKERARLRKEKDDTSLATLKVQTAHLERALAAETKRRVEAVKALERFAQTQMVELEDRLTGLWQMDQKHVDERLRLLEDRLNQLEHQWQEDSEEHMEDIRKHAQVFSTALADLRREQEVERKDRLLKEGRFLQQLESHEKVYKETWECEREERLKAMEELKKESQKQQEKRQQDSIEFQSRLEKELTSLQSELEEETQQRKREDEEIVAALNRYTLQLQQSLAILSGD